MNATVIFCLSLALAIALTLQILACALYNNWWPLLTGATYVVVPMPYLFLGGASGHEGSYALLGGDASSSHWVDVAKFLTGFSAVGMVGVPVVLAHAHMIQPGQLALALPSAFMLLGTALAYDYFSKREDDGGGYAYSY